MEILTPGVKHGQEADGGAQEPWIGGDCQQGLRSRAEENAVNWVGILKRKVGDLLWHGKHHVEILRG